MANWGEDRLRRAFDAARERDEPRELADLVLEVAHDAEDRSWAEDCCAKLMRHRSANVRGDAVAGLGHLARRFGQLDRRRLHRLVETALHDRSEYVRRQAQSAAEDLETFLAWRFDGLRP